MSNLTGKPPMGQKGDRAAKGAGRGLQRSRIKAKPPKPHTAEESARLSFIAAQPCVICGRWPVEVHHCKSGRYSQKRAPHNKTIPLCYDHHRGDAGFHTNQRLWESLYGPDTDYLLNFE